MKKLIILLIGVTLLVSCTDRGRLERRENRIEGTWYFDKAFYKGDWALFRNNISHKYAGDQITFYGDYYADYYDASLDNYYEGEWDLRLHKTQYSDGTERLYTLDMEFFDFSQRKYFTFYSNATRIGNRNMTLEVVTDQGVYTYKLNKLD